MELVGLLERDRMLLSCSTVIYRGKGVREKEREKIKDKKENRKKNKIKKKKREKKKRKTIMSETFVHFENCRNTLFLKIVASYCDCNRCLHDKLFFKNVKNTFRASTPTKNIMC